MRPRSHLLDSALSRLGIATAPSSFAAAESVVQLPSGGYVPAVRSNTAAAIAALRVSEFDLHFDAEEKILWCHFDFSGRPCFTPAVLEQAQRIQSLLRNLSTEAANDEPPVRYFVLGSRAPGVWNLGGDLALFAELIHAGDRNALSRYARSCCEVSFANATVYDLPVISIALVQGEALGGGFEAALSSNVIIAERSARFGLPEILFNLFPGMGAYSFLSRRIAPGLAERMILSGEIYTAEQLHGLGVVDVLAADGEGAEAVYSYVGRGGRRHRAHTSIRQARQICQPLSFEELMRIADLWVDAALTLTASDLRKMLRLAAAQDRRRARKPPAAE